MNTPRTPREIFLARHSSARAALDTQRDALLARFAGASPPPRPRFFFRDILAALHRELFLPYRRGWATLACTWAVLLAVHRFESLSAQAQPGGSIAHADSALLILWIEQRRQLAELGAMTSGRLFPMEPASSTTTSAPADDPAPGSARRPLGVLAPTRFHTSWA